MNDRINELDRDIVGATAAHAQVVATLATLDQARAGQPSLLPGWTRGHVVAHIALNADSHAGMLEAAARGEAAVQYPGGADQRAADIEAAAVLPVAELLDHVRRSNDRLQSAWAAMPAGAWEADGEGVRGPVALAELPFRRWREALVHLADVDLGYSWRDWPMEYVRLELPRMTMLWASRTPMGLSTLPPAALAVEPRHRTAWLLGRASIDGLEQCSIFG